MLRTKIYNVVSASISYLRSKAQYITWVTLTFSTSDYSEEHTKGSLILILAVLLYPVEY